MAQLTTEQSVLVSRLLQARTARAAWKKIEDECRADLVSTFPDLSDRDGEQFVSPDGTPLVTVKVVEKGRLDHYTVRMKHPEVYAECQVPTSEVRLMAP